MRGPRPHLPAERGVGAARHASLLRLLVGGGREGVEERVGVLAVLVADRLAVLLQGVGPCRTAEDRHLVGVRADDDRHVVLPSRREDVVDGVGEDPAVDRCRRQGPIGGDGLHLVRARGPQRLERRCHALTEQRLDESFAGRLDLRLRLGPASRSEAAATLADGGMEEAAGERRRHQLVDAPRAGRLAEDGDAGRIAPERRDVPLDPGERGDLIEGAVVAGRGVPGFRAQQGMNEVAEHPEPVVDGHQHHAPLRQARAVVRDVGAVADPQSAAMDPHQHRRAVFRSRRGPDVQVEAVLAHPVHARVVEPARRARNRVLHARRCGFGRVAHAVPRRRRLGRTPPQVAHRRGRERHAPEDRDVVAEGRRNPGELPAFDADDGIGSLAADRHAAGACEEDEDEREKGHECAVQHVSHHENHLTASRGPLPSVTGCGIH